MTHPRAVSPRSEAVRFAPLASVISLGSRHSEAAVDPNREDIGVDRIVSAPDANSQARLNGIELVPLRARRIAIGREHVRVAEVEPELPHAAADTDRDHVALPV